MIDDYWQIPYECQRGNNQEDEFFYLQLNQEEEFSSDFIQNLLSEFIPENNNSAPNNTPSINNETYNFTQPINKEINKVVQPINNEIIDVAQIEENLFDIQNMILKNKPKRSPKRAVPMTYESKRFKQAFYSFSGKNHFPKKNCS